MSETPDRSAVSNQSPEAPTLLFEEAFLPNAQQLFESLRDEVAWDRTMAARLTASFGVPYNYVQMVYPAAPVHPLLVRVQVALEKRLGVAFNNCLLNFYVNERSKMGFHSDDTSDLVMGTGVAIVSVGAARKLTFRRRDDIEVRHAISLPSGSLLYMENDVQTEWAHAIKRQRGVGPRISLTWRCFRTSDS